MDLTDGDTIVAVATPLGASHRAICRLSGREAIATARRFFEPAGAFPDAATYIAVPGEVCLHLRDRTPEDSAQRALPVPNAQLLY